MKRLLPLSLLIVFACQTTHNTTNYNNALTAPRSPTVAAREPSVAPLSSAPPVTGVTTLRIGHSNKCLDIANGSRDNFAKVQQWDCNGTGAQRFRMQDNDNDGWFAIINDQSGKCLDARAGSTLPGTRFIQYTCSGAVGHNQHFKLGPNGNFIVRHSGLCLDIEGWSQANGGELQQWACGNAQGNQRFIYQGTTTVAPPPVDGGWRLVWEDNFNGTELDRNKWNYEVQGPGWVNHELQNYTDNRRENVRVESGNLIIEARRDWFQGREFSSGRIKTQGKASWTYGRFEARIKLPQGGKGSWPAWWMMPDNMSRGWPACGELDNLEWVSYDPGRVHGTVHTAKYNWPMNTQKMASTAIDRNAWNTYVVEWYPTHIEWFVNGRSYHRFNNEGTGDDAWPYNKNFHFILNFAVGGDWGAALGMDWDWPRRMEVDYLRVYQR